MSLSLIININPLSASKGSCSVAKLICSDRSQKSGCLGEWTGTVSAKDSKGAPWGSENALYLDLNVVIKANRYTKKYLKYSLKILP